MNSTSRFQKLVAAAKSRIKEITVQDFAAQSSGKNPVLIDVREESDWKEGHAQGAIHLSRGVIELKIEDEIPDINAPIVCYCGGGSRSALVADSLQKMGYTNVMSLAGGYKAWKDSGSPVSYKPE
ncbi:MAG: rhodanese-like domain-containing protein [Gammaproteobacteria bacterium]